MRGQKEEKKEIEKEEKKEEGEKFLRTDTQTHTPIEGSTRGPHGPNFLVAQHPENREI